MQAQRPELKKLREAIAAVEGGSKGTGSPGLPLPRGVHEWFLDGGEAPSRWVPPLGVLLHLVRAFLVSGGAAIWIGRRCWPYLEVLEGALLRRCVFVDPPDDAGRLWAIDLAARLPGDAAVVVADGSGLDMAASRRLQLACEAGGGLVLCARPAPELRRPSAASARWMVRCEPSGDGSPRWAVELLRFKGHLTKTTDVSVLRFPGGSTSPALSGEVGRRWTLEWKGAQRALVVHAALVGRPGPQARAAAGARPA